MKKNILGFSDFMVVFQRSCSYIKTKAQKNKLSVVNYTCTLCVASQYKIFFHIIKTQIQRLFNRYRYRKYEICFDSQCIHGSRIIVSMILYIALGSEDDDVSYN